MQNTVLYINPLILLHTHVTLFCHRSYVNLDWNQFLKEDMVQNGKIEIIGYVSPLGMGIFDIFLLSFFPHRTMVGSRFPQGVDE